MKFLEFKKVVKELLELDIDLNVVLCEQLDTLDLIECIMEIEKRNDIIISDYEIEIMSSLTPNEYFIQSIRDDKLNQLLS